eukprot:6736204-Lingulodinium_polyedra.AAC.1
MSRPARLELRAGCGCCSRSLQAPQYYGPYRHSVVSCYTHACLGWGARPAVIGAPCSSGSP